jgi:hypothetical protein
MASTTHGEYRSGLLLGVEPIRAVAHRHDLNLSAADDKRKDDGGGSKDRGDDNKDPGDDTKDQSDDLGTRDTADGSRTDSTDKGDDSGDHR